MSTESVLRKSAHAAGLAIYVNVVIATASVAGLRSGTGGPAYSASKAGVINLVQTSAQQLSGSNVRVNAICPGLVETGMTAMIYEAARGAGKEDRIGRLNPLRRGAGPDEIARVALFLASDESSYVNGILTMAQDQNNAMVGDVVWQDPNHFQFKVLGGGPSDPGLTFTKSS